MSTNRNDTVSSQPTGIQDIGTKDTNVGHRVSGTFEGIGENTNLSVRMDRTSAMPRPDDKSTKELKKIQSDYGKGTYWSESARNHTRQTYLRGTPPPPPNIFPTFLSFLKFVR